jgi:hypothetical protein
MMMMMNDDAMYEARTIDHSPPVDESLVIV